VGRKVEEHLPVVVVSDLHVGCELALMPRDGYCSDNASPKYPSHLQESLHDWWDEFWAWAEKETGGRFNVVVNGDAIDGVHHGAVSQWTQNLDHQRGACVELLKPIRERANKLFIIRGTQAHVGQSANDEESIARELKADRIGGKGPFSHWQLFYWCGDALVHFAHHISTSMSPFAKSSGLQRELALGYLHSGRWKDRAPDVYVRSHRHECSVVGEPSESGMTWCWVTPPWQLTTPYMHKHPRGGAMPEVGGLILKLGDNGIYGKPWIRRVSRPEGVRA
jgi:hypothetical protein